MTATDYAPAHQLVQGPVHAQGWGSVGFLLDDASAVRHCRRAARWMLGAWGLGTVKVLVEDVELVVSELVTNAQRYAGDAYHAGSFTVWAPGDRVVITVHDKGDLPWVTNWWTESTTEGREEWHDWVNDIAATGGRGLALVRDVLSTYEGTLDVVGDQDLRMPGKVFRATLPLAERFWRARPRDPFYDWATA
ncbi:ATP-binding protein [Streptomyces fungicidicus]|uniref:ATP-binding protein n=1 Tax=Streptomyces fungicidicus TaxID=68203 RepID=UPI00368E613B